MRPRPSRLAAEKATEVTTARTDANKSVKTGISESRKDRALEDQGFADMLRTWTLLRVRPSPAVCGWARAWFPVSRPAPLLR